MILMILGPLSLGFQSTTVLASPAIIDRVVLTINNIPYTQTQIERYITVKESLRDQPETAQIVNASNWNVAMDGFIADMTIHQEASKSSGFRPSRETVEKLRVRSDKNLEVAPNLKAAFDRLGLSKANTETEILRIATVENYRRGRASMNGRSKDATGQWEKELKERTIVRFFDDAKVWKSLDTKI
jgi:hypothetical protein